MKKALQYSLTTVGLLSVLVFCVSASASIADTAGNIAPSFFEPSKRLLIGLGLIGFSALIKNRFIR
jgi:hypothetical protein